MSKNQFFKFFSFLKNPLWIIVVLLVIIIFQLCGISEKVHRIPYIEIPSYQKELEKIRDVLWSIEERVISIDDYARRIWLRPY